MKRHLQAVLIVLAVFVVVFGVIDLLMLPHSLPNFAAVWVDGIDGATQQRIHAQTSWEGCSAALYLIAALSQPLACAVFLAILAFYVVQLVLMVALRMLGFILRFVVRKAAGQ